jgi:hypothetical protein
MFNECYTPLNSTLEFWPKMQQLSELMERGVQMVYLTITLLLHAKPEFMNIIRISTNDVHIFQAPTSQPNITYSVIKYVKGKFKRGDIAIICKLMEQKLKEYTALAKIIIYNNNIVTI